MKLPFAILTALPLMLSSVALAAPGPKKGPPPVKKSPSTQQKKRKSAVQPGAGPATPTPIATPQLNAAGKPEFNKPDKPSYELAPADVELAREPHTMFWNCGNTLRIAGEIADATDLKVTASGAQLTRSQSDKAKFTVVPTMTKSFVSVKGTSQGFTRTRDFEFSVIKPPKPSLELIVNGKLHNGMSPISKKSNLTVRVVPDAGFRGTSPKDARYFISNVRLLAARSLGAPAKVAEYSGSGKDGVKGVNVPLGNKLKTDAPGTVVYLRVDKVYRINFQGKKIQVKLDEHARVLPFVIK